MALTIDNFIGFETGAFNESFISSSGSWSFETTIVHSGAYALRANAAAATARFAAFQNADSGEKYRVGFSFYLNAETLPASNTVTFFRCMGQTEQCMYLQFVESAGNDQIGIRVCDANDTCFSAYGDIQLQQWNHIEIQWENTATGQVYLYLNGALLVGGLTSDYASASAFDYDSVQLEGASTLDIIYDDLWMMSGSTAGVSDSPGKVEIYAHVADEITIVPDFAGVSNGPSDLDVGFWDDTADFSEATAAKYTAENRGGADGIALDSGITTDPLALKAIWRMKAALGLPHTQLGVWGNSVDGRVNTSALAPTLGAAYASFERLTESASIVPTTAQDLHLGFETGAGATNPSVVQTWSASTSADTQIQVAVSGITANNLLLAIVQKDDDIAVTGLPDAGWTRFGGTAYANQIYTEFFWKIAVTADESATSYTWVGDSEAYIAVIFEIQDCALLQPSVREISSGTSNAPSTSSYTGTNGSIVIGGAGNDSNSATHALDSALTTTVFANNSGTGNGDTGLMVGYYTASGTTIPAMTHSFDDAEEWTAFVLEVHRNSTISGFDCAWMVGMLMHAVPFGATYNETVTLAGKLLTAQSPLVDWAGALSMGHELDQSESVDWDVNSSVQLDHELDQAELGGWNANDAVSLGNKLGHGTGEILVDPDVNDASKWTLNTGWSISGGALIGTGVIAAQAYPDMNETIVAGKRYKITFEVANHVSGFAYVIVGSQGGSQATSNGVFTSIVTTVGAGPISVIGFGPWTGDILYVNVEALDFIGEAGWTTDSSVTLGIEHEIIEALLSELGASIQLDHELASLPVVGWDTLGGVTLGIEHNQAQLAQMAWAGAVSLGIQFDYATIGALAAATIEAALTLGIQLNQLQATSIAYQVALTIDHELGQGVSGNADLQVAVSLLTKLFHGGVSAVDYAEAVTFIQKLYQGEAVDWSVEGLVTLSHELDQNQFYGAQVVGLLTLAIRQFGPQGATLGNELNPDTGYDQPTYWETGVV